MSHRKRLATKGDTIIEVDPVWLTRLLTEGETIAEMVVSEGLPPHSSLVDAQYNTLSGLIELSFDTKRRGKKKIDVRYEMKSPALDTPV